MCPICGTTYPLPEVNHPCGECLLRPPAFQRARALGFYEPPLLHLIHQFKYHGNRTLGHYLGRLMAEKNYFDLDFKTFDVVIPVPLHNHKLRERTFNQALILAREVARRHQIPCDCSALRRRVDTKPQVALKKEERERNVRGAFLVTNPRAIKNKKILLIDDVFTTGGTVNECARVLMQTGARDVSVLTLARAV